MVTSIPASVLASASRYPLPHSSNPSVHPARLQSASLAAMVAPFGSFRPLCHTVPSYPICNLFFRQVHIYISILQSFFALCLLIISNISALIGEYNLHEPCSTCWLINLTPPSRLSSPRTPPTTYMRQTMTLPPLNTTHRLG